MTATVECGCGCTVKVDHDRGDRHVTCACGLEWVVRALHVDRVTYRVDPYQQGQNVRE